MEVIRIPIEQLELHPLNEEIYGEEEVDGSLMASIEVDGIIDPLIVTKGEEGDYLVVAGSRRLRAAAALEYDDVPAIVREYENEEDLIKDLVSTNIQREKDNMTRIREGLALEEAESQRAKRRQGHQEDGSKGAVRDLIGKAIGMSGKTYEAGKKAVKEYDELADVDPEAAEQVKEKINKSVSGATKSEPKKQEQYGEHNYWPVVKKCAEQLEKAYKTLSKTRDQTTSNEYNNFVGNLMDMAERLRTWDPEEVGKHGPGKFRDSKY